MKRFKVKRTHCGNCGKIIKWDTTTCWGWAEGSQCRCNDNLADHYFVRSTNDKTILKEKE